MSLARDVLKTALCPLIAPACGQWEGDQAALSEAISSVSLESPPVSVPSQQPFCSEGLIAAGYISSVTSAIATWYILNVTVPPEPVSMLLKNLSRPFKTDTIEQHSVLFQFCCFIFTFLGDDGVNNCTHELFSKYFTQTTTFLKWRV